MNVETVEVWDMWDNTENAMLLYYTSWFINHMKHFYRPDKIVIGHIE